MAMKRITPEELDNLPEAEYLAYLEASFAELQAEIEASGGDGGMTDEELVASGATDTTPEGEGTVIVNTGKK